jgi:hypothetical protein
MIPLAKAQPHKEQLCTKKLQDATGLPRGDFTLAATRNPKIISLMPRACPVEVSRSALFSCEREAPRHKAVASIFLLETSGVSNNREIPRDKPVASSTFVESHKKIRSGYLLMIRSQ